MSKMQLLILYLAPAGLTISAFGLWFTARAPRIAIREIPFLAGLVLAAGSAICDAVLIIGRTFFGFDPPYLNRPAWLSVLIGSEAMAALAAFGLAMFGRGLGRLLLAAGALVSLFLSAAVGNL